MSNSPESVINPSLMRVALTRSVVDAVGAKVEGAGDLLQRIVRISEDPDQEKLWRKMNDSRRNVNLSKAEKVFQEDERAVAIGVSLASALIRNPDREIDLSGDDISSLLAQVEKLLPSDKDVVDPDEVMLDKIVRAIALFRTGFAKLANLDIVQSGVASAAGPTQTSSGELTAFNTLFYTRALGNIINRQMREAMGLGPEAVGELSFEEARRRANAFFMSMFLSGDRQIMPYLYLMKAGNWTFEILLGDWLRELPDAQRRIEEMYAAMASQMSSDSKRAEEVTRSGIKDTDFVRLLAYKFPFVVQYAENPNDSRELWKNKIVEASVWDVVDYLYGNQKVERDKDGMPFWVAKEAFVDSKGVRHPEGSVLRLDELEEADFEMINRGEVLVYPKFASDVFAPQPKVPGSRLVTDRADNVAHAGSWDYFVDLLRRSGIGVEQVKNFANPFDDMGIDVGAAGELGSDWLGKLKSFEGRPDQGKILVVRNLCAGLAPIFSMGVTVAKAMGHEFWWNPTYDDSRVTRLIEQSLLSGAYDEQKGVSPFEMRTMLLHPTYGTFSDRMGGKRHPILLALKGNFIDYRDRVDPWEDGDIPDGIEVGVRPIVVGGSNPEIKSMQAEIARWRRMKLAGIAVDDERLSNLEKRMLEGEQPKNYAERLLRYLFFELPFDPGAWEERKVLNNLIMNARRAVLQGRLTVDEAYKEAKEQGLKFQEKLMNHKRRGNTFVAVRNSAGVVGAAVGLSGDNKRLIADTDFFDFIMGMAPTNVGKENIVQELGRLKELRQRAPSAFKGISGIMMYASESLSLRQIDYGAGEREVEAWIRYLMYNAEVYKLAKRIMSTVVQTQIDPEKINSAFLKLYSPDEAGKAASQQIAKTLIEYAQNLGLMGSILSGPEMQELMKALDVLPEWVNAHADLNQEQRRHLYWAAVHIIEGWLYSGLEYRMMAQKKDGSITPDAKPSDRHAPVVLNPFDSTYSEEEKELDRKLVELLMEMGVRVDFNVARGSSGRVLLAGGAELHYMEGKIVSDAWKTRGLHEEGIIHRPVDVYGMARLASAVIGVYLMKLGTNSEIVLQEDVLFFARSMAEYLKTNDLNQEPAII